MGWEYPSGPGGPGSVDDCYALNIDGETVWACYYSDFPIVRIQNDSVQAWTNDVSGAKAIAVRSDLVWLAGGYRAERDRLVAGRLGRHRLAVQSVSRIVLPDGSDLPDTAVIMGAGSRLHVVHERDWYVLDVR
jgi:hypothetical protein